jgi:hypothetical protein
VDHTVLVRRLKSIGYLEGHPNGDVRSQSTVTLDPVLERPALDVLHGDVVGTILRASPIVDGDNVRVGEFSGALRLAPETLDEFLVVGVLVAQYLERHVAVEDVVVGEVHFRHPPATQRLDERISVVYNGMLHERIIHLDSTARKDTYV